MNPQEAANELREIQEEMLELLERAKSVVKQGSTGNRLVYERAKSYWLAHAEMALTKNHGYLGNSGVDMDDTIEELEALYCEDLAHDN
jgi:hypothetical protein